MALPAKLQHSILSWVGDDEETSAATVSLPVSRDEDGFDYTNELDPPLSPMDLFSLSDAAAAAGSPCIVVKDGFLGRDKALIVHKAALEVEKEEEMKPAGMGRGEGLWHGGKSRGDRIVWITDGIRGTGKLPQALEMLLRRLSALRGPLNRANGSGDRRPSSKGLHLVETTSVQLARYPGDGHGYVRHRDTPKSAQDSGEVDRKITALYYLNPDWEATMGGQLRIHLDPEDGIQMKDGGDGRCCTWDVEPLLDRLVLFRSDLVDHEVLPVFYPRLAVTLWFYGRQLGIPAVSYPARLSARSGDVWLPSPSSRKSERLAPGDDTRENVRPLPFDSDGGGHAQEASIFVSIVSYRDSEANPTIVDLFARASNPARVSVGLVWQLDLHVAEDAAMHRAMPNGESLRGGRVRSVLMPAADAAGPSWARRVAQSQWNGEKYVLQIDSHTRFRPGWDSYLIRTLQQCPSFKPVLTTYPVGYQLPHKIPAGEWRPTLLVPDGFGPEGMLRQKGRLLMRTAKEPLPSPLWASGFSFSGSELLLEVPYDPGLRHSFFGEEISMAARMYTRGWDFFAPPQTVIYHLWSRAHRPSFRQVSTPITELEEARAKHRLRRLLGVGASASPAGGEGENSASERTWDHDDGHHLASLGGHYGLGTTRTLASFEERLGVDFRTATVTSPDVRNAGRPTTDFNDNIASGLEGVLKILKADKSNGQGAGTAIGPSKDENGTDIMSRDKPCVLSIESGDVAIRPRTVTPMAMSAQELEIAVVYACNPPGVGEEAARVKAQATRFCEEVKASKDGWRLALEVLRTTARSEARFFSLGCLQNALGARAGASVRVEAQHDRRMIREAIMGWLKTGSGAELNIQEAFIRTKLAVVLALLIKVDYPEVWTDAFDQLQSLLMVSGGEGAGGRLSHVDLYLRVLCALDDEVVSFHVDRSKKEAEHNSVIKDTMRMSNAVAQICGVIYEIVGAFRTEAPHVAALALETLGKYIGWIDISQVANERFLSLFTQSLRSSDENLVQRSCSCILEVVNKKMADPISKLRLLQELKLTEMLKQVPLSDEAVAVRVTELVDGVIKQLLSVWDKLEPAAFDGGGDGGMLTVSSPASSRSLQPSDAPTLAATMIKCSDMLEEALPMLWACLSHPDVDVSSAALEAVGAVLNTLKRQLQAERKGKGAGGLVGVGVGLGGVKAQAGLMADSGRRFRAMDHLPQLLETLYRRMKYPLDFAFDPSDEDEGEEDMLRQQLRKHLVNAVRQAPEFVLDFLCHALSSLPTPLSALPFPDLEAALRLIFHFGEGCGGMTWLNSGGFSGAVGRRGASVGAGASELLRSGAFPQMVLALHESDVTQHKHPQVLMLYFQLTVRYSKLLVEAPAHLLPKILGTICGPQGLSNPDVTLRTRSCYFLTKLVKALREGVAPFVDVIVPGVQAMLDSRGNGLDLSDEAKLNLYETIGYLIGMPSVPVTAQVRHLDGVLGPPMRRIADTLMAQATVGRGEGDNDAAASELASSVGAMANVSKGFKPELASEVEARFFQALEAATSALIALPRHLALRAKTMFLVHGLILCLGEGLLRGLSLTTLLVLVQEGDGKDLMEVTQLLNQLTIEYGPKAAQLLDGALLLFVRRTYQLMPGAGLSTAATSDLSARGPANGTQRALEQGSSSGFSGGWPAVSNVVQKCSKVGFPGGWDDAVPGAGGGPQLLPHEVAERSGVMKLYLSVIQHLSSNGLAGVLSSPTNSPYLGGVLRSVLGGISGSEDAATKKTCLYIFSLLLGGFNRGRSGGSAADGPPGSGSGAAPVANAAAGGGATLGADGVGVKTARTAGVATGVQRRAPAGKGGGLWQGTGATVDMEPPVRAAVTDFVLSEVVPAALRCLVDGTPAGLDMRDAMGLSAVVHMGGLLREALVAAGGSAGFVGAAAVGCNCTPQVAEQLQRAVESAADSPAITTALKAFAEHMRPTR